ncbi:hypothetical protein ABW19_dt0205533 [Dactylella cylindrospora]|nr:hypothetical protein ABW19_dt0205533 [Dactylella cylindrospora]
MSYKGDRAYTGQQRIDYDRYKEYGQEADYAFSEYVAAFDAQEKPELQHRYKDYRGRTVAEVVHFNGPMYPHGHESLIEPAKESIRTNERSLAARKEFLDRYPDDHPDAIRKHQARTDQERKWLKRSKNDLLIHEANSQMSITDPSIIFNPSYCPTEIPDYRGEGSPYHYNNKFHYMGGEEPPTGRDETSEERVERELYTGEPPFEKNCFHYTGVPRKLSKSPEACGQRPYKEDLIDHEYDPAFGMGGFDLGELREEDRKRSLGTPLPGTKVQAFKLSQKSSQSSKAKPRHTPRCQSQIMSSGECICKNPFRG